VVPEEKIPVMGVAPGVVGSLQATEVIKFVTGIGKPSTDRLVVYNGMTMSFMELVVNRDPGCDHCSPVDGQGER
jgi:adenylyltransferase/sulfurtransferase